MVRDQTPAVQRLTPEQIEQARRELRAAHRRSIHRHLDDDDLPPPLPDPLEIQRRHEGAGMWDD